MSMSSRSKHSRTNYNSTPRSKSFTKSALQKYPKSIDVEMKPIYNHMGDKKSYSKPYRIQSSNIYDEVEDDSVNYDNTQMIRGSIKTAEGGGGVFPSNQELRKVTMKSTLKSPLKSHIVTGQNEITKNQFTIDDISETNAISALTTN